MSKVSVIIPVYNMQDYLEQCLDSVVGQTLADIEIICVDDGSTDASLDIMKKYKLTDPRIVIITQENQGVAAARNNAIERAAGEFVCFMDPDDWYPDSEILKSLYEAAIDNQVKIAGGSFMDYHDGIYNDEFEARYYGYHFEKDGVIEYSEYQFDFGYQRFLFQTKMLIDNHICFKNLIRYQDPPFLVEAMICAGKFYGMNKPSYCYRYGHTQISWNEKKVCDLLDGIMENLKISHKNGLKKLHNLTVVRLNEEYCQLLGDSIFYEDYAQSVCKKMCEAYECIDSTMLTEEHRPQTEIFQSIIGRVREDAKNHIAHIEDLQKSRDELETQVRDLEWQRNEQERLKQEVYQSLSYRVGHAVTILPRWIKRLIKHE